MFGMRAGKVTRTDAVPAEHELARFDVVVARIPQEDHALVSAFSEAGFRFVTIDFTLQKRERIAPIKSSDEFAIRLLRKQVPDFPVSGFHVEGSRLHLDPALRSRMPGDFWDRMIRNHCEEFADWTVCAIDQSGRLAGFASIKESASRTEIFLFAVHPAHVGRGCGHMLIDEIARWADTTLVTSSFSPSAHRAISSISMWPHPRPTWAG